MIYILNLSNSVNVKSSLLHWSKHRRDTGGFLSLKILGKQTLRHLPTGSYTLLEVDHKHEEPTETVNDYIFAKKGFKIATQWTIQDIQDAKLKYFIIDEVGELELSNLGLNELIKHIVSQNNADKVFIFCVREPMIHKVIEKYSLNSTKVINLKQITG